MTTKQQCSTCLHANENFCNIDALFHSLTNSLTFIMALCTKNDQEREVQCPLSILHTPPSFPPIVIISVSNLWIFISTHTTQGSAIAMICPDKVTSLSLLQQPFHILRLPPACSAKSRYFHLPTPYEDHMKTICISLNKENLNAIMYLTPTFAFGNTLATAGPQLTYGDWQMYLKFLVHNSIRTWVTRVNLF